MALQTISNYNYAMPITKSDSVNSPQKDDRYPDAIWVGGAGIVRCVFPDESTVDITVVAGTLLPLVLKRIQSSTTSATLFVGLWQL